MPRKPQTSNIYQLKIVLKYFSPPIWRRVLVSPIGTLAHLHEVIQIVMDWDGDHLHCFEANGNVYSPGFDGSFFPSEKDEDDVQLWEAFKKEGSVIKYTYDFGDSWIHTVTLEKIIPADPAKAYPCAIAGKRAAPLEDFGELSHASIVEQFALDAPDRDAEIMDMIPEGYDPAVCDLDKINLRLSFPKRSL